MSNEKLMDSIGGNPKFEFTYNEHDYNLKDTVRYTIKITGTERLLTYTGVQLRKDSVNWLSVDETLAIE